jgi:catechol 2,3-dioxygenase-like lactoylglutathione lyase family enzyme
MKPSADNGLDKIKVVQIGLNTSDLAGSLQLYHELFGFQNAGGNVLWGNVMRMQGLEPDARSLIWWMVGGSDFFQLEFFTHSKPPQRPVPVDWRPSDHGWVRFGISVGNFANVIAGLERWNISALGGVTGEVGSRRLAFRDPHVGAVVEVVETTSPKTPTMTYATSSVADLAAARRYYHDVIGSEPEPIDGLHAPADEALWGLEGAEREGFVVRFGDVAVEVVEYRSPVGRPRPDRLISDQGIMNIALGSRDVGVIRALLGRLRTAGHTSTYVFEGPGVVGTYIVDPGCELEIFASPEANDAAIGFQRSGPFLAQFTSA